MVRQLWSFLKQHDAPNWVAMAFSLVMWPIVLYLWTRRTYGSIRNLQIIVDPAAGVIPTGEHCPYLVIRFHNNTDQNIYVANGSIRMTERVAAHPNADRDISTSSYALKFAELPGQPFARLQTTIPTGSAVTTGLPLDERYQGAALSSLINELRTHRRAVLFAKYFTLSFEAMEGHRHKRIRFRF